MLKLLDFNKCVVVFLREPCVFVVIIFDF